MAYVTRKDNYFWGKIGVPFDDILLCTWYCGSHGGM